MLAPLSGHMVTERMSKEKSVSTTEAGGPPETTRSDGVQSAIGQRLRAYYDDVANEPVPDRFLALLDALDAADTSSNGRNSG